MLSLSFAIWGMAALLMPGSANRIWAITLMRVITGIAQGFLIPSIHTVLSLVGSLRHLLLALSLHHLSNHMQLLGSGGLLHLLKIMLAN